MRETSQANYSYSLPVTYVVLKASLYHVTKRRILDETLLTNYVSSFTCTFLNLELAMCLKGWRALVYSATGPLCKVPARALKLEHWQEAILHSLYSRTRRKVLLTLPIHRWRHRSLSSTWGTWGTGGARNGKEKRGKHVNVGAFTIPLF